VDLAQFLRARSCSRQLYALTPEARGGSILGSWSKQMNPEVTVIVPAYRVTEYIAAALDSVLSQTFRNFEIIVVNDGCPDTLALERVLEPYQTAIRYLEQSNKGVAGAGRITRKHQYLSS
jgi:cellulose synthase/poly-beta-1,6-N-acetylglucosamine synthase-like glycosyltransferase